MNRYDIDRTILSSLNERAQMLEQKLSASVVAYYGSIHQGYLRQFRDTIEAVSATTSFPSRICVLLKTMGGSAEAAESMALILRNHFDDVSFAVPDAAMSAGTILCMSGDRIFMDYASALGPIDPQVLSPDGTGYVAAMGYLDKECRHISINRSKGNSCRADCGCPLRPQALAITRPRSEHDQTP